jgi:hypothetical protein
LCGRARDVAEEMKRRENLCATHTKRAKKRKKNATWAQTIETNKDFHCACCFFLVFSRFVCPFSSPSAPKNGKKNRWQKKFVIFFLQSSRRAHFYSPARFSVLSYTRTQTTQKAISLSFSLFDP